MAELADLMNFDTLQLMLSQCMAVDTVSLYDRLHELVNNDNLRTTMGINAKKKAIENYFWSSIIKAYESLWDSLFKQSTSYDGEIPTPKNPFANDYLYAFNHYPTSILGDESTCSITQDGADVLQSGKIPMPYTDIDSLLDSDIITEILKSLSKKPCSVQEILSLDSVAVKRDEIHFMLLWMAKYSLIHIS